MGQSTPTLICMCSLPVGSFESPHSVTVWFTTQEFKESKAEVDERYCFILRSDKMSFISLKTYTKVHPRSRRGDLGGPITWDNFQLCIESMWDAVFCCVSLWKIRSTSETIVYN